jgi:predicted ATPase
LGLRLYVALNQVDFAAMLRKRGGAGDVTRARNLLTNARSTAAEFGLHDLAVRADDLIARVAPPPLPDRLAAARTGALVGREAELGALEAVWERAKNGTPSAIMLAGELGSGKTRVVAELAARVRTTGAVVLAGGCDDGPGVPFQPFVEALGQALNATADADLEAMLGRLAPELIRLAPEIADRVPEIGEPMRSDPDTERYRLFDAVSSWLRAMTERAPVLLFLDDLQWAARPTVQLLRHVCRLPAPARLLVVGCFRDTELERGHPLNELLGDLHRNEIERLTLTGIDTAQVGSLLEAAAGIPLDDAGRRLASSLHRSTEGNPFFVREVIRHLSESGSIRPACPKAFAVSSRGVSAR